MDEKSKKPIHKKWWFWLIIVFVLGAVINSQNKDDENRAEEATPAVVKAEKTKDNLKVEKVEKAKVEKPKAKEKPKAEKAITISALNLYKAYDDNEVAADQKYRDKQLEVSGKVKDIGKDIFDKIYVTIDTGEVLGSVYVSFAKGQEGKIADLKKGQSLTVEGKCGGFTALSVTLKDSKFK
ncbi:OB-fold protein [Sporosarcina limicola]|uniref:Ribosomal protein L24 n=1 Tax=Sporosarcina limicola TaxID=34101 RepID=A0A927REQ1_9BACL|nr:hypothetical protein [Sporosarcina limicola]MBE1554807.1 ribosomal protein L24 [Sporosarcina limicola]